MPRLKRRYSSSNGSPSRAFTDIRAPSVLPPCVGSTSWEVVSTVVEAGASIGANATVICGVRIGAGALIGAASVVTRDVLPNTLVVGNPARVVGPRPRSWEAQAPSSCYTEPEVFEP